MIMVWDASGIWNRSAGLACPLRWRVHGVLAHLTLLPCRLRSKSSGVPNEVALRCNTSCIQSRRQGRDIAHFHAQKPHPQRHCHRHARHEGASNASFQGFASLKSTIQAESIPTAPARPLLTPAAAQESLVGAPGGTLSRTRVEGVNKIAVPMGGARLSSR